MPFTLAHSCRGDATALSIAVMEGVLSALAMSSMTLVSPYFLPMEIAPKQTHGFESLFVFFLPWALSVYVTYHWVLKYSLVALLPHPIRFKLSRVCTRL